MTKKLYLRRKIMMIIGLFLMVLVTLMEPCEVSHAKNNTFIEINADTDTDTGIPELDEAMGRADKMGNGAVKFIGKWVAIISLIFFVISFPSHQSEMRIIAFIAFVVGVCIYFGPEIIDGILGR